MIDMSEKYKQGEQLIAREIEGEIVIVPLTSGIGDLNAEMYSLNHTGVSVWNKLDGKTPLKKIVSQIASEYDASEHVIESDIINLMTDLINKGLITKT